MRASQFKRRALSRVVNPHRSVTDEALKCAVDGRIVVVTGASHGIGCATATRLAAAGAEVLMVARSEDRLAQLANRLDARAFTCDLSNADDVARLPAELLAVHGHVDVVVSNAGKSIRRSIGESYDRMHDFTRTIAVNYLGPVQLLLGLLPAMRERGSGHIVNVSTIGALVPPAPRWAAYSASKSAFDVWLRSVAAETTEDGVTASTVYMALVHTRMSAPSADFDAVPGLSPEQAADLVCHAIVERPVAVAPWWASAAAGLDGAARSASLRCARRYGRRIEDRA